MESGLEEQAWSKLVAAQRPRLHRYCARMLGSAFDGEDVVQEALAKATEALPGAGLIEHPESWLFRIAHNTALDALRRRGREAALSAEADWENVADTAADAEVRVSATASLEALSHLPVTHRACIVLADVLGYSLAETAALLDLSLAAVKAALHRGRTRLQDAAGPERRIALTDAEQHRLRQWADRFNARDFDALRDLLADDVRLDLANRTRLNGRKAVAPYFSNYGASTSGWRFMAGVAERRPALLVSDPSISSQPIAYVVLLDWTGDRVISIRDFRFASYVMECLDVAPI